MALLAAMLLAPLLLVLSSTPAHAVTMCLAQKDKSACIGGTVGGRETPVEGVDVTLLSEDGTEIETQTTEADGKFSFTVTEQATYLVRIDQDTLDDDLQLIPPRANVAGPDDSTKVVVKKFGVSLAAILNVRSVDYNPGGTPKSDQLVAGVADGLRLGLLLALASLGLSLIYGTTGISNFAHAEQVTLGGFIAYGLVAVGLPIVGPMPLWLGIIVTVIISAATGFLQDLLMWTPLRRRGLGLTQLMIVTIGLSLAAQYSFQYFVGGSQVKVTLQEFKNFTWGPIRLNSISLIAMGVAVAAIAVVGYVLIMTRVGQATRAVSDNPALAAASGIDVDRIVRGVWTVAAGLAGLSGALYVVAVSNGVRWDTGMQILLLLFAAVTLGGLGTAFGALVGSLIIGMVVSLAAPLGAPGDLKYAVALGLLIVLLVFRPQGLLGKAARVG